MKKDSVTTCLKDTKEFNLADDKDQQQFDRKMTKIDVLNKRAIELQPKFRLRSSLRSSYFHRDVKKPRKNNVLSNGCYDEGNFFRSKNLKESKTIGNETEKCEIQTKLN